MGRAENLAAAWRAVRHVRDELGIVAGNREDDLALTGGASAVCVARMHADFTRRAAFLEGSFLENLAGLADEYDCANCVGMSALAYVYLRDVERIEQVNVGGRHMGKAGHVFVIVGGGSGLKPRLFGTWGADAVVCDPWDRIAYPADEFPWRIKETLSRVVAEK